MFENPSEHPYRKHIKEYLEQGISPELEQIMDEKENYTSQENNNVSIPITKNENNANKDNKQNNNKDNKNETDNIKNEVDEELDNQNIDDM